MWKRGKRYPVIGKLDPDKLAWIVRERKKLEDGKEGAFTVDQIAKYAGVSERRIRQLWVRYKEGGKVPDLGAPGRPRSVCWDAYSSLVVAAFATQRCGSLTQQGDRARLEYPYTPQVVLAIMQERGLSSKVPARSRRRKWIRYERKYSNSMWHTDFKQLPDGRWLVSYLDDASRFVTGFGVFDEATAERALEVLEKAIKDHGKPASVLTDHGSQFYANEAECRKRGESKFERKMVEMEILHRLARVNHPQTNGKIERFHGELQRRLPHFVEASAAKTSRGAGLRTAGSVGSPFHSDGPTDPVTRLVHWYNHDRTHMSLNKGETPAQAFARKMPEAGSEVSDGQNGEKYRAAASEGGNTGVWVVK